MSESRPVELKRLEDTKHVEIETHPDVLGGEPVLKGTRSAARHVADLVRQGERPDELAADLDLLPSQVEAAIAFAKISPRIGRPGREPPDRR